MLRILFCVLAPQFVLSTLGDTCKRRWIRSVRHKGRQPLPKLAGWWPLTSAESLILRGLTRPGWTCRPAPWNMIPDSKVHVANMGSTWGRHGPSWVPCRSHELCYLECLPVDSQKQRSKWDLSSNSIAFYVFICLVKFSILSSKVLLINKANLRGSIAATSLVISNWSPIVDFSARAMVKFDGWPKRQ